MTNKEIGVRLTLLFLQRKIEDFAKKLEENNLFDLLEFLNRDMLKEQMEIFQKTDFHKLLRALAEKKQSIRL